MARGQDSMSEAAATLGRRGGLKGGPARMAKLTASERSALALEGAMARWHHEGRGQASGATPPKVVSSVSATISYDVVLRDLYAQRARIDAAIAAIEALGEDEARCLGGTVE